MLKEHFRRISFFEKSPARFVQVFHENRIRLKAFGRRVPYFILRPDFEFI